MSGLQLAIVKEMETIYREELSKGIPSATDDEAYNKQLTYSCAYWLLRTIKQLNDMDLIDHEWICPSGPVDADSKWEADKNAFRPRILSRLKAFVVCSETTGHLPTLRNAAARLQSHLQKIWPETNEIDLFPVFKS